MSYAMELSPAGFNELIVDCDGLPPKIGMGWLRLQNHLRRFGSIPADERSLKELFKCSLRHLRERVGRCLRIAWTKPP